MLKIRNIYRLDRLWVSSVAILLGVLAGYFVGTESILFATSSRLASYADRLLQRERDLADELRNTLAEANASSYPPCSDQDITLLRRLTFSARFLKDVGRLHENTFLCSATTGRLAAPIPMLKPDMTLQDGTFLYKSYPLYVPAGDRGEISAFRNADAVIGPDTFSDFPQQPLQYAVGAVDPAHSNQHRDILFSGIAESVPIPAGVLKSDKTVRVADRLYRARCLASSRLCAVTSIRIDEVWRNNRALLFGYIASGAAAGIACAAALAIVGRKKRSHANQLKRAILSGRLSVAYQPIVELGSHRIVGAEALTRWIDEDGESIRPETIVALAEAEGFASDITRFILTQSLEEIRPILEWNPAFRVNVNLAPADLADPRLLLLLDEKLDGGVIKPANIAFELTERATSDRDVAVAAIHRFRERGHATFIDDFGTGYSNLAYLTELNVDGIKVNRTFIATIGTESVTASIVPQILAVAQALDLRVVVQGIEREDQAKYFADRDPAILGQGWFFGLPVPAKGLIYLCSEKSE
ncbi:EAL domain-containing protein [Acidicapsa acidisoli]|uniref:EAL domain-containing protein n=1 Tax=Acidicapsa acidisoli TaxID=1615681 RepID=UPI0021E08D68|nr:EAL domain-containing protein [Acidicapsa acidisoli]